MIIFNYDTLDDKLEKHELSKFVGNFKHTIDYLYLTFKVIMFKIPSQCTQIRDIELINAQFALAHPLSQIFVCSRIFKIDNDIEFDHCDVDWIRESDTYIFIMWWYNGHRNKIQLGGVQSWLNGFFNNSLGMSNDYYKSYELIAHCIPGHVFRNKAQDLYNLINCYAYYVSTCLLSDCIRFCWGMGENYIMIRQYNLSECHLFHLKGPEYLMRVIQGLLLCAQKYDSNSLLYIDNLPRDIFKCLFFLVREVVLSMEVDMFYIGKL